MKQIAWGICLVVLLGACAQNSEPTQTVEIEIEKFEDSQAHALQAVLWHQRAAEYKALCFQTYNLAKIQLKMKLQNHAFPYDLPPAIVMDLDETVIDNSPYNAQLIMDGEEYTRETWKEWTDKSAAVEIPGAIDFILFAQQEGVKVKFISNRRVSELESTMKNLQELGVTNVTKEDFYLKDSISTKEPRRDLVRVDYEILMLFGDNLADFSPVFDKTSEMEREALVDSLSVTFGDEFIVLPNVLYGDWEGALLDYNYGMTSAQKDSVRRAGLQGYR